MGVYIPKNCTEVGVISIYDFDQPLCSFMTRKRGFHIVVNNYTDLAYNNLKDFAGTSYGIIGKEEAPTTGTPHLQCYFHFRHGKTEKAVQKLLFKATNIQCHAKFIYSTPAANIKYCSKMKSVYSWGHPPTPGERTDIKKFLSDAKTMDELDLADKHPEAYVKYYKAADRIRKLTTDKIELDGLKSDMEQAELNPWQQKAVTDLFWQDDRKILWYVDFKGGAGKTFLTKWLLATKNAFVARGGKVADIAYAYKNQDIVVFDFTRDKEEFVNYSAIEALKDGLIASPKYESSLKVKRKTIRVICFSNFQPDLSKLSDDRWDIREPHKFVSKIVDSFNLD